MAPQYDQTDTLALSYTQLRSDNASSRSFIYWSYDYLYTTLLMMTIYIVQEADKIGGFGSFAGELFDISCMIRRDELRVYKQRKKYAGHKLWNCNSHGYRTISWSAKKCAVHSITMTDQYTLT